MRLIEIIKKDLENENLRLEEQLEFSINEHTDIDIKVNKVKLILEKLAINEITTSKFNKYLDNKSE